MSSRTLGRIVLVLLVIGSLIVLFPLALRLANPFATLVYNPAIDARILLLWPDRVELQPIRDLANFSPRPPNAAYTFLVPPERQAWVTEQLRASSTPTRGTSWRMWIKPLEPGRQEIDLELLGDGIYGVVYEASSERIVPLRTRLAGPGFAFIVFGLDVVGSVLLLLIVLLIRRFLRLRRGRGLAHPFTITLHSGCPSLVAFFATGWGSSRRRICGVNPNRSRFRAVHRDSISTIPARLLAQ